jgi:predicted ATP-grasp superfamily ATP-dependent carboligase
MRILVHEFVSGGGFAGRDAPASLAREGAAMRTALAADLAAAGGHQVVVTADPRFPLAPSAGVEVVTVSDPRPALLDQLVASADAVWLVAPETDRCLERLAARMEATGRTLLGSSARAIRDASDKGSLARRLRSHGIPHPDTRVLRSDAECLDLAREIGYPLIVKPVRGAGCARVCLARNAQELNGAVRMASVYSS